MTSKTFMEKLEAKHDEGRFVCVGLDPQVEKLPESVKTDQGSWADIIEFNAEIVKAVKDVVCAFKPNMAFYEGHEKGFFALKETIRLARRYAPGVPIILDAKRADIGKTNEGYARMAFDMFEADAVTVHPYLGRQALSPFLSRKDKGVIVLARTSNPGAGEFQDLLVNGEPLFSLVARQVANEWNENGNCALVAGATYPEELAVVRKVAGEIPILIPGVGTQGGDVAKTVKAGKNSRRRGMIINSSSGIIHASTGPDFAEVAGMKALELHQEITRCLEA